MRPSHAISHSQQENSPTGIIDLCCYFHSVKIIPVLFLTSVLSQAEDKVRDFWFSGAEISSFKLEQARYGKIYPGHAELIFVTEPFLADKQVKNENGGENSTDVLKLNFLTTFNTGIYSYRTMTSTFRPIDLEKFPHALKTSTSVQDWCGQAFQQYNLGKENWKVEIRSYFENPGDENFTLPVTYLEDELWLTLRLDPKSLPIGKTKIIPGAIYTRYSHIDPEGTTAEAKLSESGKTSTYSLHYPSLDRTLKVEFDTAFPHIIRKWTESSSAGTTTGTLEKRLMNVSYWSMKNPEDSEKRKQLNLEPIAD